MTHSLRQRTYSIAVMLAMLLAVLTSVLPASAVVLREDPPNVPPHHGARTTVAAAPTAPTLRGLSNFHLVAPGIYRGAAPTAEGLATLKSMNIHTIIDLRIEPKPVKLEKARAKAMGFNWINLPMGSDPPTAKQVATFLAVLTKAPKERVFVHCQYGADRTGCMIGIYRVSVQGWPFAKAYAEMLHYGFKPHLKSMADAVRARARMAGNK